MNEELQFVTQPEELLKWMKEHEEFKVMGKEEAKLLLDYMEGHDYRLGLDKDGGLFRIDVAEENQTAESYSVDDAIDVVCEWNYELIRDTEAEIRGTEDQTKIASLKETLSSLKEQEQVLDRLFEQTIHAVKVNELAEKLANAFLENLKTAGVDLATKQLVDEVRTAEERGIR